MANEWFYSHDGERHGPVPVEQIKDMAASGQFRRDDLVWQTGMADWMAAGDVPGLLPPPIAPPRVPAGSPAAPTVRAGEDSAGVQDAGGEKNAAGICGSC